MREKNVVEIIFVFVIICLLSLSLFYFENIHRKENEKFNFYNEINNSDTQEKEVDKMLERNKSKGIEIKYIDNNSNIEISKFETFFGEINTEYDLNIYKKEIPNYIFLKSDHEVKGKLELEKKSFSFYYELEKTKEENNIKKNINNENYNQKRKDGNNNKSKKDKEENKNILESDENIFDYYDLKNLTLGLFDEKTRNDLLKNN